MKPLPLGHQLIPLLCFQLLTDLLILWITLLKPQVRKNLVQPPQKEKKGSLKPSICGVLPKLHKSARADQR